MNFRRVFDPLARQTLVLVCFIVSVGSVRSLAAESGSSSSVAVSSINVTAIDVVGCQRIDPAAVRQQLKSSPPRVTASQVSEDVKTLYRTGFFDQVTAKIAGSSAQATLRFEVTEKPVVRKVFIRGNEEIEASDLEDILKFDARRFLDRTKIDVLMKQVKSMYQSRGYYDAGIEYSVVPVGENEVDLTFTVSEGERVRIDQIRIAGLKEVDEDEVLSAIQTREYSWWKSWLLGTGRLNTEALENDKALMRQYFFDHGYIDVSIGEAQIEREGKYLTVTFPVEEGRQYSIGTIRASGDLLNGEEGATLEGIISESGQIFNAGQVREDSFRITDKYTDRGYAFANVVPETEVLREVGTVNLQFAISQGNLASINKINIRGNDKTYDNVIRREFRADEQEMYSGAKVRRTQEVLQRLGLFEEVNISTEPVGSDKVDLNVNVREGSTGTFSAGAGYSTSDGLLFNTRLSENNIFGTGRRASVNLDVGTERDSIVFSLDDRRLYDSHWSGGLDILRTDREFSDFDRRLAGGSFTLGYPFEELFEAQWLQDVSYSMKYEYLDIDISNVDVDDAAQLVIDSEGTSRASSITPRLVRNTINNPLNPTKGSRQDVSVELAGLGGNQDFYLLEARNTLYHPLVESSYGDLIFSWRFSVGYGESFDDEPFPLYRRFFPGGINSVRGFKNRSLGPKDDRGNEYGGSKELVNNLELIFPLINAAGVRGVVFYDFGEAFDDDESIDFGELREAYGFGLRWASPLGPIRVEFGFPLDKEEGEDSMVTLFSFGAPL